MMRVASPVAALASAGSAAADSARARPRRRARNCLDLGFHWAVLRREASHRLRDGLWPGYTPEVHALLFESNRYPLAMREATAIWRGFALASLGPPLFAWFSLSNQWMPVAALLLVLIGGVAPMFLVPMATAAAELARRRARRPTPHALRELAMLPMKPAAAKWLLYAPHAAALSAGAKLFCVSLFLSCAIDGFNHWRLFLLPAGVGVWEGALVGAGLNKIDHCLPILATVLLAVAWRRFAIAAPLAGWSLSIRFPLPLAMPLAFLAGARVACCTILATAPWWIEPPKVFEAMSLYLGVGHGWLLLALACCLFLLLFQTADVGFYLPRDWAREDDKRLNRAGPEALEQPGSFRDWGDLARCVGSIAWPCPMFGRFMPLALSRRRLAQSWREEARTREENASEEPTPP